MPRLTQQRVLHVVPGLLLAFTMTAHAQTADRFTVEAVIDAPADAVWSAYTTKQGLESWMAPLADVELAIGGRLRTHFDPNGKLGDTQTIENTILSFEPHRMLSTRVAKAPANLPYPNAIQRIWSVVYFIPEGPKTRLREVTMGFGDDQESQQLKQFLEKGSNYLMGALQKRFAGSTPQSDRGR